MSYKIFSFSYPFFLAGAIFAAYSSDKGAPEADPYREALNAAEALQRLLSKNEQLSGDANNVQAVIKHLERLQDDKKGGRLCSDRLRGQISSP